MTRILLATLAVLTAAAPVAGQDIRGLELCTVEKAMDRRTSCLQSNVEFLQQALAKQVRETQGKLDAAGRAAAAQRAEIVALKAELEKLQRDLAELKKDKSK